MSSIKKLMDQHARMTTSMIGSPLATAGGSTDPIALTEAQGSALAMATRREDVEEKG